MAEVKASQILRAASQQHKNVGESVQPLHLSEGAREVEFTPELIEKIITAFVALEDVLSEAFPNNKIINRVLGLLADFVSRFF